MNTSPGKPNNQKESITVSINHRQKNMKQQTEFPAWTEHDMHDMHDEQSTQNCKHVLIELLTLKLYIYHVYHEIWKGSKI